MADKKNADDDEDPRLVYISSYLLRSMKLKNDKWNKLMNTDEYVVSSFILIMFTYSYSEVFKICLFGVQNYGVDVSKNL